MKKGIVMGIFVCKVVDRTDIEESLRKWFKGHTVGMDWHHVSSNLKNCHVIHLL